MTKSAEMLQEFDRSFLSCIGVCLSKSRWVSPYSSFSFRFQGKHAFDSQFLCSDGLWGANRSDEREIRKTLAAFYERDRQYRTVSSWNCAQSFHSGILFEPLHQFRRLLIHNMA